MSKSLEQSLLSALPIVEEERKQLSHLDPLLVWVRRRAPRLPPPVQEEIRNALRAIPRTEIFDEKMWVIANTAGRVSYDSLARWLAGRSLEVGIDQTIADFYAYLDRQTVPCHEVLVIGGVSITKEVSLAADIQLVPYAAIPDSYGKLMLHRSDPLGIPVPTPTAGLLKFFEYPKVYLEPETQTRDHVQFLGNDLEDARLCLTLAGPCATVRFGSYLSPAESVPLAGMTSFLGAVIGVGDVRLTELSAEECQHAAQAFTSFRRLNSDQQAHIRIPLTHLNSALMRRSLVDSAIELRVAMESFFLEDMSSDRGELGFRLRLRAARLLEKDESARKRLWKLFGDLYRAGSIAVHTGRLGDTMENGEQSTPALLEEGYKELARAIGSWMATGGVDWLRITLS